jgi:H/ACA ribonucleoprotein complex subunit 2
MAKEKTEDEMKVRKEKKEKKEKKRSEDDGVSKKVKKEKKHKSKDAADTLLDELEKKPVTDTNIDTTLEDAVMAEIPRVEVPLEALVPFANPLADEKQTKKLLRAVQKGMATFNKKFDMLISSLAAKHKTLHRGVKEVVKSIRKSPSDLPASSTVVTPTAVVILAADISPMDVISHLPVLCEDHSIPYMYIASRAELGAASNTKRPTSVVMVKKDRMKKAEDVDAEKEKEYLEAYADLVKVVQKAGRTVRV